MDCSTRHTATLTAQPRSAAHRALAREAATAGMVLLRNERARLPLSSRMRRIAVIGADATEGRVGGYSPPGARAMTIADGIRAGALAGSTVRLLAGVPQVWRDLTVIPASGFTTTRDGASVAGSQLQFLDDATKLVEEPGTWRVMVGASSKDIRLRQEIVVP